MLTCQILQLVLLVVARLILGLTQSLSFTREGQALSSPP